MWFILNILFVFYIRWWLNNYTKTLTAFESLMDTPPSNKKPRGNSGKSLANSAKEPKKLTNLFTAGIIVQLALSILSLIENGKSQFGRNLFEKFSISSLVDQKIFFPLFVCLFTWII